MLDRILTSHSALSTYHIQVPLLTHQHFRENAFRSAHASCEKPSQAERSQRTNRPATPAGKCHITVRRAFGGKRVRAPERFFAKMLVLQQGALCMVSRNRRMRCCESRDRKGAGASPATLIWQRVDAGRDPGLESGPPTTRVFADGNADVPDPNRTSPVSEQGSPRHHMQNPLWKHGDSCPKPKAHRLPQGFFVGAARDDSER